VQRKVGYAHTNTRGITYYLHAQQVRARGRASTRTVYYFSPYSRPEIAAEIPLGWEVQESARDGTIYLMRLDGRPPLSDHPFASRQQASPASAEENSRLPSPPYGALHDAEVITIDPDLVRSLVMSDLSATDRLFQRAFDHSLDALVASERSGALSGVTRHIAETLVEQVLYSHGFHPVWHFHGKDSPGFDLLMLSPKADFVLAVQVTGTLQPGRVQPPSRQRNAQLSSFVMADAGAAATPWDLEGTEIYAGVFAVNFADRVIRASLTDASGNSLHGSAMGFGRVRLPTVLDPHGEVLPTDSAERRAIELNIAEISDALIRYLSKYPEELWTLSPRKFEELVAELYARRGFEITLTRPSGDEGVDLYVVRHDDLGTTMTVVQCKRYARNRPVGVSLVRELIGTVELHRASAGVLLTTSRFTRGARGIERSVKYRLALKDYFDLQDLLKASMKPGT
jgi:hypothetical protein